MKVSKPVLKQPPKARSSSQEWKRTRASTASGKVVPKGRDEDGLDFTMSWVRHHDKYENGHAVQVKTASAKESDCGCEAATKTA